MNTYQIRLTTPRLGHFAEQAWCSHRLGAAGINYDKRRWVMCQGLDHFYEVSCDEKSLMFLILSTGATVEKNLTQEWKESGLSKLTDNEKEALGLL